MIYEPQRHHKGTEYKIRSFRQRDRSRRVYAEESVDGTAVSQRCSLCVWAVEDVQVARHSQDDYRKGKEMTIKEMFEVMFADGGWIDFLGAVGCFIVIPVATVLIMGAFV